ncbi:glucose-methanol-choline oxidoreductase [Rhodopirellula baltica SH28]|uniref:Glucose-methanol-choline oxidoreductase n=2 Tax=Rhodopirellula baltica TaxID=265606 RepID=K5D0Q8_RHOBT|nr:glucose-methanol-choline oxidoreductase [Rhodopirellula baltica SH28]
MPMEVERPDHFSGGTVILGGGLCGLILAHELAISLQSRMGADAPCVWVVEAPCVDIPQRDEQRPIRWLRLLGGKADYQYQTQPSAELAGRSLPWPRGKGLGGSGRINSMIWFPPTDADFQSLAQSLVGEQSQNADVIVDTERQLRVAFERAGEIVRPEHARWISPASRTFLDSVSNGSDQDFHVYDRLNRNGRRWTAASALTDLQRTDHEASKLIRIVKSNVSSVRIEGDTVTGIGWADGATSSIASSVEVISALGAIGSPTLLHRSGIDDSNIGGNLHDHLIMPMVHSHDGGAFSDADPEMAALAKWQHTGGGPIACNIAECGGLDAEQRWQLHVTPTDYLRFPKDTRRGAMTIGVNVTRPLSRGRIRWRDDETIIDAGYWNDDRDRVELLEGVRWVRNLVKQSRLDQWLRSEMIPGAKRQTDDAICAAMARYSQTLYHPAGTCALGSVVDSDFSVRGMSNLRVVDASVLAEPTTGNPTATLATLACFAAKQFIHR